MCVLLLISTPIGNLGDISERARGALSSCDILICEDTRHTGSLLKSLHICAKKLLSFHRGNESREEDLIIRWLQEGKIVGVVSDAGTPCISDPGSRLVARCHRERITVSIIPGPCAFASAYALSGVMEGRVQFLGFLPKPKKERMTALAEALSYSGATVVYESPFRLIETLTMAQELYPAWKVTLVRELTKLHEEVRTCVIGDLVEMLLEKGVKGECCLVFHPAERQRLSDVELVKKIAVVRKAHGCSLKEAVELVSRDVGVSQRELYRLACEEKDSKLAL